MAAHSRGGDRRRGGGARCRGQCRAVGERDGGGGRGTRRRGRRSDRSQYGGFRENDGGEFPRFAESLGQGGGDRKVYKVRALQTERGNFEVKIDSLKEKQSLYPLGSAAGLEAFFLLETSAFPLDKLQKEWQGRLREMDTSLYLVLRHTPLGTDSVRVDSLGDASIARPDNELGRYYLDDMYTSMLTAYARADFWKCVEWESPRVWVAFLFFLSAGALGLVVMFWERRQPSPASLPVSEEEPVWSIGRWVYHKDTMKLTCEGEKVDIQPQSLRLFCAFMLHGGYLSYADINEALGWHESSLGLDSRRKRAISTLRTVLREKDARIQIKHEEEGYRISVTD